MNKKVLSILAILILVGRIGLGQVVLKYGPELGVSTSGFPKKETWPIFAGQEKVETNLFLGPLIGFKGQAVLGKNLQFDFGLQYQMAGERSYSRTEINFEYPGGTYTQIDDYWSEEIFHKLCLPATVGYKFSIGKVQPVVFCGIRPGFFISGKGYEKAIYNQKLIQEYNVVPFKSNPDFVKLKHFTLQYTSGLSVQVGQNLNLAVSASIGKDLPYGFWEGVAFRYRNTDYSLSVSYLFKAK